THLLEADSFPFKAHPHPPTPQSTITLPYKLQAHYMPHEPSPAIPTPPIPPISGWMVPLSPGMLPIRRPKNAKKPRVGGAEFGRKPSKVSTAHAIPGRRV